VGQVNGTAQGAVVKVLPEADRYAAGSGYTRELSRSFHTAASYLSLPGPLDTALDQVRAAHRKEGYKVSSELIAEDRSRRVAGLLTAMNTGDETGPAKAALDALSAQYRQTQGDPALMRKFLTDADTAMASLQTGLLAEERAKQAAFGQAMAAAEAAMAAFASTVEAHNPDLKSSLAKLQNDPASLTEQEWTSLQGAFQRRQGSPELADFLQARTLMQTAGADLDAFYAANPALAAYRADLGSHQRFHWQALLGGAVADGARFSPGELGAQDVPAGAVMVKAAERGKEGFWTEVDGKRLSFKSFDGSYTVERLVDESGVPIERRILAQDAGRPARIEIINRTPAGSRKPGSWKKHVGHWVDGAFVHSFSEMDDGSLDVGTAGLFAAQERPDRLRESGKAASVIVGSLGWDADGRGGPLSQWLADGFSSRNGSVKSMRLRALPDGTVHVIYERADGAKDIYTAKFTKASPFEGRNMGEALVALKRSRIGADGSQDVGLQRRIEYLPDGSRLLWRERYGTTDSGFFSDAKSYTQVSLQHVTSKPGGGLDWDNARTQRREDLDVTEDINGTSSLGILSEALHETPALGHALKGLGWVGDRGYNGIVGGYQNIIAAASGSDIYELHGMAGSMRMTTSRDDTDAWTSIAGGLSRGARGELDGDVRRVRERYMRSQGLTRDRMLDPGAYNAFLGRKINNRERGQVMATAVGAGTYGQLFADWAADSTGMSKVLYETAGVGMTALESVPQSLPVLLALGPLGRAAGAGSWTVRGVSMARVAHGVISPYVMTSWGVNIPLGVTEFVEGIREDDPNKLARGGGQAVVDGLFLAVAARNFAKTLKVQRIRARASRLSKILEVETPEIPIEARSKSLQGREAKPDALMREANRKQGEYLKTRKTDAGVPEAELTNRQTRAMQERVKADQIYTEAVEIGRGMAESPVKAKNLNAAMTEGSLAKSSVDNVAVQGSKTCGIHSWVNNLRTAGIKTSFTEILKIIERDLGPEAAQRARTQGLTSTEMTLMQKAVAIEKGIGLREVPQGRVFSQIAKSGRGASVTIRTGNGQHRVFVEGTVKGMDGRSYVSYIDSNVGGRTFLPVESFALLARSGGTFTGGRPPAKTYAKWQTELQAFRQGRHFGAGRVETARLQEIVDGGETVRIGTGKDVPPIQYMEALQKFLSDPSNISKIKDNPVAYRNILGKVIGGKSSTAQRPNTGEIAKVQKAYKESVLPEAEAVLQRYHMTEADVVSHGTSLKGFLGMVFEGGIRATNSFGDGAQYWAAKGTGGATYLGAPAGRGQAGVLVLMENKGNRLGHTADFTTKAPQVATDFLAVIITDGKTTVVLDKAALMTLSSSAAAWKSKAADYNRPGWKMSDLSGWEKYRDYFEPSGR